MVFVMAGVAVLDDGEHHRAQLPVDAFGNLRLPLLLQQLLHKRREEGVKARADVMIALGEGVGAMGGHGGAVCESDGNGKALAVRHPGIVLAVAVPGGQAEFLVDGLQPRQNLRGHLAGHLTVVPVLHGLVGEEHLAVLRGDLIGVVVAADGAVVGIAEVHDAGGVVLGLVADAVGAFFAVQDAGAPVASEQSAEKRQDSHGNQHSSQHVALHYGPSTR